MDTQEYILSGTIEAYVLGLLSDNEAKEVETYAAEYAEIKEAITRFEIALEKEALNNAVPPPAFLKDKIMAAISEEDSNKPAAGDIAAADTGNDTKAQPARVVPLHTAVPKSIRWMRSAIAASVILLLGSTILNFYYYSLYKRYSSDYSNLLAQQSTLAAQNETYRARFDMLADTAVIRVTMQAASAQRAGALATVFWNKQTKDVYITVNNLPQPTAGKQYQLWAIVDGKPVDAGMIENNAVENNAGATKMNPKISNAQAFAITLEKKGGSPSPDMNQLFVIGNI